MVFLVQLKGDSFQPQELMEVLFLVLDNTLNPALLVKIICNLQTSNATAPCLSQKPNVLKGSLKSSQKQQTLSNTMIKLTQLQKKSVKKQKYLTIPY